VKPLRISSLPGSNGKMLLLSFLVMAGVFLGFQAVGLSEEGQEEPAETAQRAGVELNNLSLPPGLKTLTGIVEAEVDRPVKVQVLVDGEPAAGMPVSFRLVGAPAGAKGHYLSAYDETTDDEGVATTWVILGSKPGTYVVGAFYEGRVVVEPVQVPIKARGGGWVMFLLFGLLGGLGIFLMGMELAGDGLKDAAGDRMRGLLSALTTNRFAGVTVGALVTAVLQSSSVTTVMLVGFVSATMMTVAQAVGVMMGAKIGTTITAQIIAFKVSKYSLMFVAAGFIMQMAAPRKAIKQVGTIVLGFGMIFFGLAVMGDAMRPLRTVAAFTELLVQLGDQPLLGILLAIAFTAIVQSSSATIGIVVALCAGGLLSLEAALPLAFGAHIGTCATALLSSIGSPREGKQLAVAHLVYSLVGVIVAFPFLGFFIDGARWLSDVMGSVSVARQLANGHTIFTVASALVFMPFIKYLAWVATRIVPPAKTAPPFGPQFLSDSSLAVPVLALEQAHREIMRMTGIVRDQLSRSLDVLAQPDEEAVDAIIAEDDKVDILEKSIRPFLARVARARLEPDESAKEHAFIYVVQDLEGIGDVLSKEIAPAAGKLAARGMAFSPDGLLELQQYGLKVLDKFDRVSQAVETFDRTLAEQTIQLGFKERVLERRLREAHLERLHHERKETVETSALHLSVLNNLTAVSNRLEAIARTLLVEL